MTLWAYNLNIPFGPNNPSVDQPNMLINTNNIANLVAVDHVGFNLTNGGYHSIIHEQTQTNVTTVAGVNQLFSGVPGVLIVNGVTTAAIPNNGDTQLYSLSGQGGLSQLTGNSALTNGYQWIGETLIQWGQITVTNTNAAISFTPNFPNNVFNIQLTLKFLSITPTSASILIDNSVPPSKTGFRYSSTAAGAAVFLNWFAIGN